MNRRARRVIRCGTCMKRKVKCGAEQPHCQRCTQAGLHCDGYSSSLIFVDESTSIRLRRGVTAPPAFSGSSGTVFDHGCHRYTYRKPTVIQWTRSDQDAIFTMHILSSFSPPHADESMALLTQLIEADKSPSAQALSAIYYGKTRNQFSVYSKGVRLYVRALDALQRAIVDPWQARNMQTLVSVICLCVYENIVFSEQTAWLKHYEGVARLIEFMGPDWPKTEFERDIYRLCRFMTVLSFGVRREHCFLADPIWKSIHKAAEGDAQVTIDVLYDAMVDIPGIMHDVDNLNEVDRCSRSMAYTRVREKTSQCLDALYRWTQYLQSSNVSKELSKQKTESESGANLPLLSQATASALALRDALVLCLSDSANFLNLPLQPSSTPNAWRPELQVSVQKTLALNIYSIASSIMTVEQSTSAAFFFIFPLQIASQHMDMTSLEGQRLKALMDLIAENHGFETARLRH